MAKLRKGRSYTNLERPYTRKSKYKKKSFVRSMPVCKVTKFVSGNAKKNFEYTLLLHCSKDIQLRHNALESARQSSNRLLEKKLGTNEFFSRVRVYPHHALRENPLASGAGADRMSTGMSKAFGKVIGIAAQVKKGQPVFEVQVNTANLETAKLALTRAKNKLPCDFTISMTKNA
ncbi:MAG: 50S ribosomal protein L16 [archaeon]